MSKLACFVLTLWLLAAAANASWQINFARIVSDKGPTGKRKSSLGTIQTRRILLQDGHGSQKRDHGYHPESEAGRFQDAFCASLRFKASRKTPQPRRIRNDLKMKILDHLLVVRRIVRCSQAPTTQDFTERRRGSLAPDVPRG
jgi:hypothetical protein